MFANQYRKSRHRGTMPRLRDIFRRKSSPTLTELTVTGGGNAFTSAFHGDPYANDVFRAGVDAIAKLCAKFVLMPVAAFSDGTTAKCDDRLAHLLQVRPNRYQTAYDMLYMLFTHLYAKGNAYAYIQRNDANQAVGIYPLHVTQCRHFEDSTGTLYSSFTFANGTSFTCPYQDVIHLRRFQNAQDINGDSNDAISSGVVLADTMNAGIRASIRTAGQIKGVVRYSGALGKSKLDELKRQFEETFLAPENTGGVITTDTTFEYVPFETRDLPPITAEDQKTVRDKIYNYLGITEAIVNGSFDDSTFGAFEETTIEALALQTSLEFTAKVYGDRHDRRVECQTSRIRYIGTENRNELLKNVLPMGALTINEARDLMGLAPLPDGDYRIQSLNYSKTSVVDEYQIAKSGQGIKTLTVQEVAENDQ